MLNKTLFLTHYMKAQQLYKDKLFKEAENSFLKASEYKSDAKCHFKIGMCFFKQELWEDANVHISKAIELVPDNKDWRNQLTQVQRHLGKDIKSSAAIAKEDKTRKLLEYQPENASLYSDLAQVLNKQGKWWQEVEALQKAVEINSNNIDLFYRLALAQEKMNRFLEAAAAIESAIDLKKKDIDAQWYYRLGYNLEKSKQSKESITKAYDNAIKNDKKLNSQRYGIGIFHQHRGLWKEASLAYNLERETNPLDDELLYKLAMSYDRQYKWEHAKKHYIQVLLIKNNRPYTLYRLGFVNERLGNYKEAILAYEEANRTSKNTKKDWLYRKAHCLSKIGAYEEAVENYKLYLDFNSLKFNASANAFINSISGDIISNDIDLHNTTDLYLIANRCFLNKDFKNAVKYLKECTKIFNEHKPEIFWKLGISLANLKYSKEACEAFKEMKIFKNAYEVPTEPLKNKAFERAAIFTEYYENSSIEKNTILYESFHGGSMSCNPYAIFLNLFEREEFKGWRHIWVVNGLDKVPEKYKNLPNVYFISRQSYQYVKTLATAEYVVNNVTFPEYYSRRDEQKYINTWHGTPIKFLGKDIKDEFLAHRNVARNFLHTTHMINPNKYTMDILLQRYDIDNIYNGKRIVSGYPRVDLTINLKVEEKNRLREDLGILEDDTLILYAPTWRGLHGAATFDVDKLKIDLEIMKSSGHKIMFKGHHMVEKLITDLNFDILLAPNNIDTNVLLGIVDMLITDYSSIAFDFIPCHKPILYYAYDIESYNDERGLYFPLEELPGLVCYEQDELSEKINQALSASDNENSAALEKFCSYDKGDTTDNVIASIFKNNHSQVEVYENDKRHHLLIFAGPFIPNGITTSILNLVNNVDYSKYSITIVVDPKAVENIDERMEQINKLPKEVSILGKIGSFNLTVEDTWINNKFIALSNLQSEEMWKIFYSSNNREYQRLFGKNTFDTTINFDGYSPIWAQMLSGSPIKSIIYLHNNLSAEWQQRFPYLEKTFRTYKYYDKLISVSEKTSELNKGNLAHLFKLDKNKFDFADNLQNPQEIFYKMEESLEGEGDEQLFRGTGPVFITLGRLSLEKDQTKLIKAFSKIVVQNTKAKLLILGAGPLEHDLIQLIKSLKLEASVHLLGRKFNPFPYLKRADCFVLSSNHEGQPMVLLEALIMGKPIIATDIVGNRSVLENRPGLLVDNSEEGLIQGMNDFINGNTIGGEFDIETYQNNAIGMFYKKVCVNG